VGVLNRIGGALLLLGLAIAVIIGFQTPTGRRFWDGIWQAAETVVLYIRDQATRLGGTPIAGNPWAAIGVAALLFLLVLMFVPGLRQGRGFAVLAVVFTIIGFILYNPSVISG
jgi:hypothetical protein